MDSNSDPIAPLVEQFLQRLQAQPEAYLVGLAGVPGSGKTSFCQAVCAQRPDITVVPMDGYHLPRSVLDAEGMRRRGSLPTFDGAGFVRDLTRLRTERGGRFPAFDHAEKDPRPNAISVPASAKIVIVEGIYVLMSSWQAEPLFDLRVFLDVDLDEAVERLATRHVVTGIADSPRDGRHRAITNDRVNAEGILADGCRERADLILRSPFQVPLDPHYAIPRDAEFAREFPWQTLTPEAYAAQHVDQAGHYDWHLYCYRDSALGHWARRLGVIYSSPVELACCQSQS